MRVLGIDTSCDETSVAVVESGRILAQLVCGQNALHEPYGGVVPEIAARAHVERLLPALSETLEQAGGKHALDAIAVTTHPGLVGPLLVGLSAAKALALVHGLPLVGVHHLEAHVASAYLLPDPPQPPFVALVASGGHTVLYEVPERGRYELLGQTQDDAAGECFDKVAALLGLGYPGGPAIEKAARDGDAHAVELPRPLRDAPGYDFSFSGLKTAVLYKVKGQNRRRSDPDAKAPATADLAACTQEAIADVLSYKAVKAARRRGVRRLVLGGGVAANTRVRELCAERAKAAGIEASFPPLALCTDNAAMVAVRGEELLLSGVRDGLDLDVSPYAE